MNCGADSSAAGSGAERHCLDCGAVVDAVDGPLCPRCGLAGGLTAPEPDADGSGDGAAAADQCRLPKRFGDYELLEEIGCGGMGVVYRARQVSLDRTLALKVIRPELLGRDADVRRFRREAHAAGMLQHPGIVAVHEAGEVDGQPFYSMELVRGRSLADVLQEDRLSPAAAAATMRSVAEAVHSAHEQGVLHRDLKPSNILIDVDGRPRVTDFGLARVLNHHPRVTATGDVMGSPSYMAPEQARGRNQEVDERTDVYALGATLYELLTGRAPFAADTPVTTLKLVLDSDPTPPRRLNPGVPRDLETVCLTCLSKEPSRRYESAARVADDLGRFLAGRALTVRPQPLSSRMWRWCRRRPLAVALAACVAAVGWLAWQGHQASRNLQEERLRTAIDAALTAAWAGREDAVEAAIAEVRRRGAPVEWEFMLRAQMEIHRLHSEEAITELGRALEHAPDSVVARAMLSTAYLLSGRAVEYYRMLPQLSAMAPVTAMDHLFLGSALVGATPDTARPVQLLERALAMRPSGLCLLQLSMAEAFHAGDIGSRPMLERALRHVDAGMTLVGDEHPLACTVRMNAHNVALRLCSGEECAAARAAAEEAVQALQSAKHPCSRMQRAFFFQQTGARDAELDEWRLMLESGGTGLFASYYASAMLRRGESAAALNRLDRLQGSDEGLIGLARAYLMLDLGRVDEAAELHRQLGGADPWYLPYDSILLLGGWPERAAVRAVHSLPTSPPEFRPLLACLTGSFSFNELVEAAAGSGFAGCEAQFWSALAALAGGERDAAMLHLRGAVSTGAQWLPSYHWSLAFLERLEQDPLWPNWIDSVG